MFVLKDSTKLSFLVNKRILGEDAFKESLLKVRVEEFYRIYPHIRP